MALAQGIYMGAADPYGMARRQPVRNPGPFPGQGQPTAARPQPQMMPPVGGPPQAQPGPMFYENPTVRQQRLTAASMAQGNQFARSMNQEMGSDKYDATMAHQHEILKQKLAASAARYGAMRMQQLQQVQGQLPPELVAQMQGLPSADPAAAWRAISGAFTQQAAGQGYQDPRLYLNWLLQNRGQTNPMSMPEAAPY